MPKRAISIIMGRKSDLDTIQPCLGMFEDFRVDYELKILSAHRQPERLARYIKEASKKQAKIFIAAAGGTAALAGVVAAHTTLPVIGVPVEARSLKGLDSLLSIVQMPSGIPVGCMAIGKSGAKNAAIFALQILALNDKKIAKKLLSYKRKLASSVKIK